MVSVLRFVCETEALTFLIVILHFNRKMKFTLFIGLLVAIAQNVSGLGVADCGKPVIPPR